MADHRRQIQWPQAHPQTAPSNSKILAVLTLFPVSGILLLLLAGVTFAGSLIGLAVTTPLFMIFSPVLVPAAIIIASAVAGFLTSGAFGISAVSSFWWIMKRMRGGLSTTMHLAP